jgi:hypothetical protein
VIDERAPHATKVFDRFHSQRLASDAVDEVRRAEVFRAKEREDSESARALKRTRWALLKSPWNLTPPPNSHLTTFHGVFAPNARLRPFVTRQPEAAPTSSEPLVSPPKKKKRRLDWATLHQRTFGTDVLKCACGGRRRIHAVHATRAAAEARLVELGVSLPPARRRLKPATAQPSLRRLTQEPRRLPAPPRLGAPCVSRGLPRRPHAWRPPARTPSPPRPAPAGLLPIIPVSWVVRPLRLGRGLHLGKLERRAARRRFPLAAQVLVAGAAAVAADLTWDLLSIALTTVQDGLHLCPVSALIWLLHIGGFVWFWCDRACRRQVLSRS